MSTLLPNADQAVIPPEKLRGYALNPEHPRGKNKARVFKSALGIGQGDWEYLRDAIKAAIPAAPISSVQSTQYGFVYAVPILVEGLNGQTHEVITAWFSAEEGAAPSLTSAYVNIP